MYLILGFARTGKAVEKFCIKKNIKYRVYDDKLDANFTSELIFEDSDWNSITRIIISPVFRTQFNKHKIIEIATEKNIEMISDLDLFYENLQDKNNQILIGITGSNGKSTTSSLCFHLLKELKQDVVICGNIGIPILEMENNHKFYVVEISSAQIEISKKIQFNYSTIINITSDHIDYHGNFENYIKSKIKIISMSIFTFLEENLFLDLKIRNNLKNRVIQINKNNYEELRNESKIKNRNNLIGEHNLQNIIHAFYILEKLGFRKKEILENITTFRNLEHRIEEVAIIQKIRFINDSKATNADSVSVALKALNKNKIALIAGGRRKSEAFLVMKKEELENIKKVFLIGECSNNFASELEILNIPYLKCENMKNATTDAFEFAKENKLDIVLLSPLCASFDQYRNFEERGKDFKNIVKTLIKNS